MEAWLLELKLWDKSKPSIPLYCLNSSLQHTWRRYMEWSGIIWRKRYLPCLACAFRYSRFLSPQNDNHHVGLSNYAFMWFSFRTPTLQAPRTSRASLMKGSSRSNTNTAAQQALIAHWQGIVKSLGNFVNILKVNNVGIMFLFSHFLGEIFWTARKALFI